MTITWLHLSDFHFQSTAPDWRRDVVQDALFRDVVSRLADHNLAPDIVLVTGDIAFSGQKAEYEIARRCFDAIATATNTPPGERWFLVPGNHDVDRSTNSAHARRLLRTLGTSDDVAEILESTETLAVFTARQRAFYRFTRDFLGTAREWSETKPWSVDSLALRDTTYALLCLNSAWAAEGGDGDQARLLLGEYQIRTALRYASSVNPAMKIALFHHPLEWLQSYDQEKARELLLGPGGVHFALRGHLHRSRVSQHISPDSECIQLATGACWQNSTYPHGVNVVRLSLAERTARVHLWRYSADGRGFWAPDNLLYESARAGVCSVSLPPSWQLPHEDSHGDSAPTSAALAELDVAWDRACYSAGTDMCRALVRVHFDDDAFASESGASSTRTPVHHILVLDVSGSMNEPAKYPVLQKALTLYISFLSPDDLLTLIPFSSETELLWTAFSVADIRRLGVHPDEALDAWPHRFHGTVMAPALKLVTAAIQSAAKRGFAGTARLQCLTDGHVQDKRDCHWSIRDFQTNGIEVNLFGFGSDFDVASAEELLSSGPTGVVRYVPAGDNQLEDYFGHLARTSQRIIASDGKLAVSIEPAVTCFNVFVCRPHERHLGEFSNVVAPTITHTFGAMEYRKSYEILVEIRAWQAPEGSIGHVVFEAGTTKGQVRLTRSLRPTFGAASSAVDPLVETMASSLRALVSNDRDARIDAVEARIRLFTAEGRAPQHIDALRRVLSNLKAGGDLEDMSSDDRNFARADAASRTSPLEFRLVPPPRFRTPPPRRVAASPAGPPDPESITPLPSPEKKPPSQ